MIIWNYKWRSLRQNLHYCNIYTWIPDKTEDTALLASACHMAPISRHLALAMKLF